MQEPAPDTLSIQNMLQQALSLQRVGRLPQAIQVCEQILAAAPQTASALHLLGTIANQIRQPERAFDLFGKAAAFEPGEASFHFDFAMTAMALKRWQDALTGFDRTVALKPDHAQAWSNRGVALKSLGELEAAVASYDKAIELKPDYALACFNRALALKELGRLEAALASYDQAIRSKPDFAEAHSNRGTLLQRLKRPADALASFDRAIALKPLYAEAWSNRGNALQELDRLDDAIASYDKAIVIRPDNAEAHYNRGTALRANMQQQAAVASFDRAIALDPDHAQAHLDKALLKLLMGEFEEGWRLYEWRWRSTQKDCVRDFSSPRWLGDSPLQGKTILLHAEQGFGDTLQFCRYVALVAATGARVIMEAPEPLADLLKTLQGVSDVVPSIGSSSLAYDFHCPLLSLPLAFRTTLETIPSSVPYLHADPAKAAHWRDKLADSSGLRVGVVWSGGSRPDQPEHWQRMNARRNVPLMKFAALDVPGVRFYSLQIGAEARQELARSEADGWTGPRLHDLTDELASFSDTAALIANLDLVISVDTAVAHLAGALGKPVWLLNRFDTCWRWLRDREDSPWYPTMRVFRQRGGGDWEEVLARVRRELVLLVG